MPHYHDTQTRALALTCYYEEGRNMSKAIQRFEKECETEQLEIPSQPRSFIKYQVDKFQETKSMENRPHHPDSKIIKDKGGRTVFSLQC